MNGCECVCVSVYERVNGKQYWKSAVSALQGEQSTIFPLSIKEMDSIRKAGTSVGSKNNDFQSK